MTEGGPKTIGGLRMDVDFNNYHVDPRTTYGDISGRYPPNFVKFPWFTKPLIWSDTLSRAVKKRPAHLLKDKLLKLFDMVDAPAERWGSAEEIGILRENLVLFSERMDANPHISPIGRVFTKILMTGHLKNRADTVAFYEQNRSFIGANGRFKAPLIVTGFPRTGTTLLQRLLSEDPATRSPFTFEMEKSTPPLKSGADPMKDPRIAKSAVRIAALSKMAPGFLERFAESHPMSPIEKEESMIYMQAHNGVAAGAVSAGRDYFHSVNLPKISDALFRYERNFFTMLDAYCPAKSHWTLKAPNYAPYFSKLFDYYPDARVVVTHRHPSRSMASVCRMIETSLLPFDRDGSFDKIRFGDIMQSEMSVFLSAPLDYRAANPQHERQIVDCMYQELVRDPIAMVKQIYTKFDLEYTSDFEKRMQGYLDSNKQGEHGRHKYSNEEYGIVPVNLYTQNKAYFDRYGFEVEARSGD